MLRFVFDHNGILFRNTIKLYYNDEFSIVLPCYSIVSEFDPILIIEWGNSLVDQYSFSNYGCNQKLVIVTAKVTGLAKLYLICTNTKLNKMFKENCSKACITYRSEKLNKLSDLSIITLISSKLGQLSNWHNIIELNKAIGYNAIHFTPQNVVGKSKSSYSIACHRRIDENITTDRNGLSAIKIELDKTKNMLYFSDVVLNHISFDSEFILNNPDAGYNQFNSPWLNAAIEVDNFFEEIAKEILVEKYDTIDTYEKINEICNLVSERLVITDWFKIDKQKTKEYIIKEHTQEIKNKYPSNALLYSSTDGESIRLIKTIDDVYNQKIMDDLYNTVVFRIGIEKNFCIPEIKLYFYNITDEIINEVLNQLQSRLEQLCIEVKQSIMKSLESILIYERITCQKYSLNLDCWNNLVPRYFTKIEKEENGTIRTYYLANNGWVMNWNSEKSFIEQGQLVYFKRQLVCWSDCIKLNYNRQQCPALFDYIEQYVIEIAKTFDGVRIDNCHSTCIEAGSYFLAKMREVNPKLIVFAELFVNNKNIYQKYIERFGIDYVVNESINYIHNVNYFIDTLFNSALLTNKELYGNIIRTIDVSYTNANDKNLYSGSEIITAEAANIFYDYTHDNTNYYNLNIQNSLLTHSSLMIFSGCAYGTTFGADFAFKNQPTIFFDAVNYLHYIPNYEAIFLHQYIDDINIIHANMLNANNKIINTTTIKQKTIRIYFYDQNRHTEILLWGPFNNWKEGIHISKYNKQLSMFYIDMPYNLLSSTDFICKFQRNKIWTNSSLYKNVFDQNDNINNKLDNLIVFNNIAVIKQQLFNIEKSWHTKKFIKITYQRIKENIYLFSKFDIDNGNALHYIINFSNNFLQNSDIVINVEGNEFKLHLNCFMAYDGIVFSHIAADHSIEYAYNDKYTTIYLKYLHENAVIVFSTKFKFPKPSNLLFNSIQEMNLLEINYLLWSSENEERSNTNGIRGIYDFPDIENTAYAGLMGTVYAINKSIEHMLETTRHNFKRLKGFFKNLGEGDWLLKYHLERLVNNVFNANSEAWNKFITEYDTAIRYIVCCRPIYSYLLIKAIVEACKKRIFEFNSYTRKIVEFYLDPYPSLLLFASTQFCGYSKTGYINAELGYSTSAGLPFFSHDYMREWGRDTFISFPGIFLSTGRNQEIEQILFSYAKIVRNSLIPNLVMNSLSPRYNCRDAIWFFFYAIILYVNQTNKISFLFDTYITLNYPIDELSNVNSLTIFDLIIHVLNSYYNGIDFIELNAGKQIDEFMQEEGFHIKLKKGSTGFMYGGNQYNCLTWMDKMGSSIQANNIGIPSTPRDGAPIELTALLYKTLVWVCSIMDKNNIYKNKSYVLFKEWADSIAANFISSYLITEQKYNHAVENTFKDTVGCIIEEDEYNLKPNYFIALGLVPELFTPEIACKSILIGTKLLLNNENQIGIKTLNKENDKYNGIYDNSNNSNNALIAHGANYHQGPEWLMPLGYWFLSVVHFFNYFDDKDKYCMIDKLGKILRNQYTTVRNGPWFSLPELTNENGSYCQFSCNAQCWSVGTMLYVFAVIANKKS